MGGRVNTHVTTRETFSSMSGEMLVNWYLPGMYVFWFIGIPSAWGPRDNQRRQMGRKRGRKRGRFEEAEENTDQNVAGVVSERPDILY